MFMLFTIPQSIITSIFIYLFLLNVWCSPLTKSMQTNAVLIIQKTSKGDISGNTAYTLLGSTCIISTGGKITVRSTALGLIVPNYLSCPICHLYHTFT